MHPFSTGTQLTHCWTRLYNTHEPGNQIKDRIGKRNINVVYSTRLVSLISLQRFLLSLSEAPEMCTPKRGSACSNFSSSAETAQLGRLSNEEAVIQCTSS